MRLRVLLQTKDGRMEIGGIGPWALCQSLGKELTKSDEITLEITHERDVEGKYTLALSVGDEEVGRVDASTIIFELNLFKMFVRGKTDIKSVVILDKP